MNKQQLLETAAKAAQKAHAPYSNYKVGAALLCFDGTVVAGCNVENASYGLSNCAERTALFAAVAEGHRNFAAMAIVADGESMPVPCGACRQVLAEFSGPDFEIYCGRVGELENAALFKLKELLPHAFKLKD